MQRSEDGCGIRKFRSFNHSECKTVLNLLEAVYLRLRKIVVERVTVLKLRVDSRGRDVCKYYIGPIGDLSLSTATAAG